MPNTRYQDGPCGLTPSDLPLREHVHCYPFNCACMQTITFAHSRPRATVCAGNWLQKWEAHIRGDKTSDESAINGAQEAWRRWAGVSRQARTALKRANPEQVAVLELSYLHFMEVIQTQLLSLLFSYKLHSSTLLVCCTQTPIVHLLTSMPNLSRNCLLS